MVKVSKNDLSVHTIHQLVPYSNMNVHGVDLGYNMKKECKRQFRPGPSELQAFTLESFDKRLKFSIEINK